MHTISRAALALFTLLAVFGSFSCDVLPHGCTTKGCGPTARILADLPPDLDALRRATLTICRNDDCRTGMLIMELPGSVPVFRLSPPAGADAGAPSLWPNAFVFGEPSSRWLEVSWMANSPDEARAGDRYRVTLTGEAGNAVVEVSDTAAKYETTYPNGPDCAPPCPQVVLDHRKPAAGADR